MVYEIIYEMNLAIDYNDRMVEEIRSLGECQHIVQNVWFIRSSLPIEEINKRLTTYLEKDSGEKLMVIGLPNNITYKGWLPKSFWPWLKKSLKL